MNAAASPATTHNHEVVHGINSHVVVAGARHRTVNIKLRPHRCPTESIGVGKHSSVAEVHGRIPAAAVDAAEDCHRVTAW